MTGETIAQYRILEKIGEGGMGVVYKAEDTRLRRIVALKFLQAPSAADSTLKARFFREAQAAGSLDHPNICPVHDLVEAQGHMFLVMAYVDGPSLSSLLRERSLPLGESIDIVLQAGEGLRAAHQKAIVHRDVKSANLLITRGGAVRVTDFGLALLGDRSRLTRPGTVMGTVSYMAPEQLRGRDVDRRADIWSLGVVLFEAATGSLPSARQSLTLPDDLEWILGKMMAREPGERYQHMDDVLVDLRRVRRRLTPEQAQLSPPRRQTTPADATQTHPWWSRWLR